MEKAQKREFDAALKKVYDALKGVSPGSIGGFVSSNEDSVSILTTKVNSAIENLTSQAWNDSISATIANSKTQIADLLKNCTTPAHEILGKVQSATADLQSALDNYNQTLNRLNAIVESQNSAVDALASITRYKTTETTNSDGDTVKKTEETDEYVNQVNKINGLNGEIATKDEELANWKTTCESYISMLKGLLSSIGSEASTAALAATIGVTKTWDSIKASDIDEKFGDEYRAEGTETYDANGKLISRTYTIYDKDGKVIRSGTIHYDSDGKPTTVNYVEHYDKPTPKEEIIEHAVEGDDTGLTAYFSEEVEAVTTEVEEKTQYAEDTDGDNLTDYETESHVKKEFDDGAKTDMEYKEEGQADITDPENPDKQPEVRDGEGTLTTPEGDVLDAKTHEEWGENGRKENEIDLKDHDTGDAVVDATDITLEVDDDKYGTGIKTEETQTVVDQADSDYIVVTSGKTQSESDSGEELYSEGYTARVNRNDPNLTEMEVNDRYPDHKIVTHYNDKGELIETETVQGEVVSETPVYPDNKVTVTYTYTDSRGQQQSKTVTYNTSTSYGCAQLNDELKNAQSDAGYWNIGQGTNFFWDGPCENRDLGGVTVTVTMDPNAEITVPEAAPTVNGK